MPAIRKRLRNASPTNASLRCSARVNLDESPASVFSFVSEHRKESRPSCITNGLSQLASGQAFNVQILHGNCAVFVNQFAREFVLKVRTLIADQNMSSLKQLDCLEPSCASSLAPGYLALTTAQSRLSIPIVARIGDCRAISEHGEAIQSDIDSRSLIARRQRRGLPLYAEAGEPASSLPLKRDRLDLTFKGPMQGYFDVARAMSAQLSRIKQLYSVWVFREADRIVALRRAVARKACFASLCHTPKESMEGAIHALQNIPGALKTWYFQEPLGSHRLQLFILIEKANRLAGCLPRADAFLKRAVVKVARLTQLAVKKLGLRVSRIQAILVRQADSANLVLHLRTNLLFATGRGCFHQSPLH
jgi:hypothetical protein